MASPSIDIASIEMAMNELMKNGQRVIYGFPCSRWSNTSDDAGDLGTPLNLIEDKGSFKTDVQFAYLKYK